VLSKNNPGQDNGIGAAIKMQRAGGYENPVLPSLILGEFTEHRYPNVRRRRHATGACNGDSDLHNQVT